MAPRRQQDTEMDALGSEAVAQARENDVESMQPLPHSLSWTRSWKMRGNRASTGFSAASIGSTVSHWSIHWVARWTPSRRSVTIPLPPESLSEAHSSFITAILDQPPREELKEAYAWYMNFLEFKIRDAWATLFIPVLKGPNSTPPSNEDLSLAFQILQVVVGMLGQENLALTDIVDKLYNSGYLRETDEDRSYANQLVLASLGWITCLYPAKQNPEPKQLEIMSSSSSSTAVEKPHVSRLLRRRVQKETLTNFSQPLDHKDQPLHTLLGRFGNIIPQRQRPWMTGHLTPSSSLSPMPLPPESEKIEVSLLCFLTLSKVANFEFEWVDSLSLHLEFDVHTTVLKLFRLPSLCLLMCCGEKESPLSQLFCDATESHRFATPEPEDASDFHREVLLSYRLIFGQDASSSSAFLSLIQDKALPLDYQDPLLPILCGTPWDSVEAKPVYGLIEAEPPSPQYAPSTHFPFLGKRLLDIQRHVDGHKTNSFSSIWYDKRNASWWWTFWPVFLFGGVSLILQALFGFIQTIMGGYQVYYARQQVLQQQGGPP